MKKLADMFHLGGGRKSSSSSTRKELSLIEIKFQELFSNIDLFHMIILSGFLSTHEICNTCCLVSKQWHSNINQQGWNMFFKNVLITLGMSLDQLARLKISTTTIQTFFGVVKGWKRLDKFMSVHSFSHPNYEMEINVKKVIEFMCGPFETKPQEQYEKRKTQRNIHKQTHIPYQESTNTINSFSEVVFDKNWFIGKKELSYSIILYENCIEWEYKEYLYTVVIEKSAKDSTCEKEYFQIIPTIEVICNERQEFEGEAKYLNPKYQYLLTCSDYDGTHVEAKTKDIVRVKDFTLRKLDNSTFGDFGERDVPTIAPSNFKKEFHYIIFKLWRQGLLTIPLVRNYIFQLFLRISGKRYQSYFITFHNTIENACDKIAAVEGVQTWFDEYLKTQQRNEGCEIFHTYVKEEAQFKGAEEGESLDSYLLILNISQQDFEFVQYNFYEYELSGEILS